MTIRQRLFGTNKTRDYKLGSCCCCGTDRQVRNVMMLPFRAPEPGKGWGCVQCGLEPDGAIVVLCDACLESGRLFRDIVSGYPKDDVRVPYSSITNDPFEHDLSKHPEVDQT